ncbi:hypothetical protein BGZ65_008064 [Modicella reniformis]|uniref:Uncharacterized protein n=1 Tax=Modicella reniformis TaxID=1440133 RepID=A0A9P6LT11_9FUNG|nr:hypothetical protein BGZ65_008064 [Modicella reniformis]
MAMAQGNDDPLREYFSRIASGLEKFCSSFQLFWDEQYTIFALAIRCLFLQTVVNLFMAQLPQNTCTTFNHLPHSAVFLLRCIYPEPWDELFMSTVRSLGCDTRSDLVNRCRKPPQSMAQLMQYLRRVTPAFFAIGAVHWCMDQQGLLAWPCTGLALLAAYQYLLYRNVRIAGWTFLVAAIVIGPQWIVWCVQIFAQQQLFLYELLQPYLVRVQFKKWEERAWLQQYDMELQGFALGAWFLCTIPFIGVAAIPLMVPAVVFLLSKSCGVLENSGNDISGGIIEKRTPGIKTLAMGQIKVVTAATWDSVCVDTHIKSPNPQDLDPSSSEYHDKIINSFHKVDNGTGETPSVRQIQKDREFARQKKQELRQSLQQQQQQQQPAPSIHSTSPSESIETYRPKNMPQYGYRDRKPSEIAPSAPPAPSFIPSLRPGRPEHLKDSNSNTSIAHHPTSTPVAATTTTAAAPTTIEALKKSSIQAQDYWRLADEAIQWPGEFGRRMTEKGRHIAVESRRFIEESQRIAEQANAGRKYVVDGFQALNAFAPDLVKKGLQSITADGDEDSDLDRNEEHNEDDDDRADRTDVEDEKGKHSPHLVREPKFAERVFMRPRGTSGHGSTRSSSISSSSSSGGSNRDSFGGGFRKRQYSSAAPASDFERITSPGSDFGRIVSDTILSSISPLIPSIYQSPGMPPPFRRATSSPSSTTAPAPGASRPRRKAPWQRGGLSEIIAENMQEIGRAISEECERENSSIWRRTPHIADH